MPNQSAEIRLVVSDIDGTLVTKQKQVTPRAMDAINKIRESGILFSVISSRPPRGIEVVARTVGVTEPIPAFNGGMIVKPDLRTAMRVKRIEPIVVEGLLKRIPETGIDTWVYTDTDWFVLDVNGPKVQHEAHAVKYEPTQVKDFSNVPLDRVCKMVGVSENFDAVEAAEKALQQEFAGAVSATRSQRYYLDITHPTANKGEGILLLSELLNIPTANIAVIGDMENDIYMFRQAGLSIAMGQATPSVQREAQYVTSSNEEEGFANAMERYILAPRGQAAVR